MREGIWVRTLNVLNLKYERLVHNSAKVVPLQAFGKFSVSPPHRFTQRRKVSKRRAKPVRTMATYNMPQRQARGQQLWRRIATCVTRDQGPQLAAGGGWTVSLQHVSISGYLLGAMVERPALG